MNSKTFVGKTEQLCNALAHIANRKSTASTDRAVMMEAVERLTATSAEAAKVLLEDEDAIEILTLAVLGKTMEHAPDTDYDAARMMKKSQWREQIRTALKWVAGEWE